MEIAALVCNNKLSYDSTFQAYSMFEYLKKQGNQVQVIDYNFLSNKSDKKNKMLYNFLSNNIILTVNRYSNLDQFEEKQPLVDKYIVVNGSYNDLNIKTNVNNNIAYGIRNISNLDISKLEENYSKISISFDSKRENINKVVDPIFLLSKEEWSNIIKSKSNISKKDDYILVYSEVVPKEMLKYALNIAQKNKLKVYIVSDKVESILHKGKHLRNVNPIDLASLILNAQDVITSCNDGIKFSVLLDKNIHIFTTNQNEQLGLINELNIEDRIVYDPENYLDSSRNYEYSHKYIDELKEKSFEFLKI